LVTIAVHHSEWKIEWQYYAKIVSNSFLEKDPFVQQILWKNCNTQLIQSLLYFDSIQKAEKGDDSQSILNIYFPKGE
jgi:hypothetical protein